MPFSAGYCGGICSGWPSCSGVGVPGVRVCATGAVHAVLWLRPADICRIFFPFRSGNRQGSRWVTLFPSPSWPSTLDPQHQTSPVLVRARVCSAPTTTSSTKWEERARICWGLLGPRRRPSGWPIKRSRNSNRNHEIDVFLSSFLSIFIPIYTTSSSEFFPGNSAYYYLTKCFTYTMDSIGEDVRGWFARGCDMTALYQYCNWKSRSVTLTITMISIAYHTVTLPIFSFF